jgi:hypothetical protein
VEARAEPERASWRAEAALGGYVSASGGDAYPELDGTGLTYWVQALRDDGVTPFGALTFTQHPDTLALSVVGGAPPSGTELGAALSASVFPFRRTASPLQGTGVFASAGFREALAHFSADAPFSIGLQHFLGARARFQAAFQTDRTFDMFVQSNGQAQATHTGFDAVATSVGAFMVPNRLFVEWSFAVAWDQLDQSALAPTVSYARRRGIVARGDAAVAYYATRTLSLGLHGGLHGSADRAWDVTGAEAGAPRAATAVVGGDAQWFVLPWLYGRAGYELTAFLVGRDAYGVPVPTPDAHRFTLQVGARF